MTSRLPASARPELGPDATAVGWVYQYALVDRTGTHDLAQLTSLQDWFLECRAAVRAGVLRGRHCRRHGQAVSVVIKYSAVLRGYDLPLLNLMQTIKRSNGEAGAGALVAMSEARYMIRVAGYLGGVEDLRNIAMHLRTRRTPPRPGWAQRATIPRRP